MKTDIKDERQKKLVDLIKDWFDKEYLPWRNIEGDIKEHLLSVFSSRNNSVIPYLRVEDIIWDDLYEFGYMDLEKFYKNQGFDVNDGDFIDKIQQKTFDLINKEVLDPKIFSENTLKLHPIAKKIENVCTNLWDIYNNYEQGMEI